MESTYTESTISKLEDKEETIKFDESELEEQLHRGRDKREDYHFILVILQPVDIKFFQYVNQLILVQYYLLFSELFLIILILKKIINQLILAMIMMIKLTKLMPLLKPNLVIIHSIVMILVILLKNSRLI